MKNLNLFLIPLFSLIVLTISCNKATEFNPEAALTQHIWTLKGTSLNGEIQNSSQEDIYTFQSDHTFHFVSGSVYFYEYRGDWKIEEDRLLLRIQYNENDPSAYDDSELIIHELSNSTLTLGHRFEQNGQMNSFRSIYKSY